jgi:hypothetical protein
MEQVSYSTRKINLSIYKETIERFLPFVFIRCSKYTNSNRLAEIIAVYTFITVYRLTELLDGYNIQALIEMMVDIVGEDLGKGSNTLNGLLLFKWEDDLFFAKRLAQMGIEECLNEMRRHKDFIARNFAPDQFDRITATVMDYLTKQIVAELKV